jgi:hypothetical protein
VHAVIEDPRVVLAHALEVLGGAQVQVVKGRGTRFDDLKPGGRVLTGRVVATDGNRPGARGQLILTFATGRGAKRELVNEPAKLVRDGTFKAPPGRPLGHRARLVPARGGLRRLYERDDQERGLRGWSIVPTAPGVNPSRTIAALAEREIDRVLMG